MSGQIFTSKLNIVSSDEPGFSLKNAANSFQTHFAKNSSSQNLAMFKLSQNSKISWGLDNANQVAETNDSNSVTYQDILTSCDLQYVPYSDGLKENIILKDTNAPNTFTFSLNANGLKPVVQSDGSIAMQDDNSKTNLVIPKPYMFDSNKQVSQNVTMKLDPTSSPNIYTLTITADSSWLNDTARQYPITIDPDLTTSQQNSAVPIGSNGADTYIAENSPYEYYNSAYMTVGHDNTLGATRALLKFNLPSLPAGAIVTDGVLSLYKYTTTSSNEQMKTYRIVDNWDPMTVKWSSNLTCDTNDVKTTTSVLNITGSSTGYINFNVWDIAKGWINGNLPNYGFMVTYANENDPLSFFYSNDKGSSTPLLSITYMTDEIGVNPYWGYSNTEAGAVNTANGNLITSVSDFSLPGRGIPITVTRTYNSRGNLNGIFGQKWFSSLDMQLTFKSWGVVLTDSAGTERPFMLNSDGKTYTAPTNYPVQLYQDNTGSNLVYHIQEANLTGKYQSVLPSMTFDSSGKLIQLDDGKGNSTKISWNPGNNIIVTDPSGRTATLTLNAGNYVTQITTSAEPNKVKASYIYNGGYLTGVTYDDGAYPTATVNYQWNNGLLTSLTDKNGVKSYVSYNNSNQAVSVGTVNMLSNPSFEAGPGDGTADNWTPYIPSTDGGSVTQSTNHNFGHYGLDLKSVYKAGSTGTSYLYASQKITVNPNQNYELSGYLSSNQLGGSADPNYAGAQAYLNIEQLDANGNAINWAGSPSVSGSLPWTKVSEKITAASNAASIIVYLEVQHDSTHFGGDAYFDGIQLEEGSSTSDFQGHTDFRYGTDSGSTPSYQAAWATSPAGELTEYENDNYGTPVAVIVDPKDSAKPKSKTILTWDASDNLRSLTTPEQANSQQGTSYTYTYDQVGNMKTATDPLNRTTSMDYYDNRLSKLTLADGKTVQHVWDPTNLNNDTDVDQTLNSVAYSYDSLSNPVSESNLLGLADNRILNSAFESLSGSQPNNWITYTPSGTKVNKVEYDTTAPYKDINNGSNVLHINPGTNNNAYQWTDYIDLGGNTNDTFTASAFIKAAPDVSQSGNGACINVYWYNSSKQLLNNGVPDILFYVKNADWQRYTATFTPPSGGAAYARVMAITYGTYNGYFDNIQFEKSQLARGYDFLENSSFEQGTLEWTAYDSNAGVVSSSNAYSGSHDAQINLTQTGTSYLESQTVLPVKSGQYYTLLGYMETSGITPGTGGGGARLHIYFYNSTGGYINDYVSSLGTSTTAWTKYAFAFTPPANSATAKVRIEVANAKGAAAFDNIRLSYGKLTDTNTYDSTNNYITSTTDQLNNTINITNDAYGQATQVKSPTGQSASFTYDGEERLRTATDNAGSTAAYNMDGDGNVTDFSLSDGTKAYDSTAFTYDSHNNVTSETDANNANYKTNFTYDEDGRNVKTAYPNGSSVSSEYDNYGNLDKVTLSDGTVYNYSHDLEGRLTNSSATNGPSRSYSYDAVGNLLSKIENISNNSIISKIDGPSTGMYSPLNYLLTFSLTYGSNSPITFSYNYTGNGLVSSVTGAGKTFSFNYDEGNNLTSKVNPNNTTDNAVYNEANQITNIKTVDGNNNIKYSSSYQYDKDGRITQVNGTQVSNGSQVNTSASYTYNSGIEKLNRLTQAVINDGTGNYTLNYSYDAAGNISSMDAANYTGTGTAVNHSSFTYDSDNRVTNSGFDYDLNGNLTSSLINGKNYTYGYDAENRLISVKDGTGSVDITYTYDSDGNRATKTSGGVTTTYHYFDGQLLYETQSNDAANIIHALYIWSPSGKLEAVSPNYVIGGASNTFYYYHYDAHGDVSAITDGNGNIYWQFTYDPYGNILSVKDSSGNYVNINGSSLANFTYAGYYYDQEDGLYFLNSRYYAPEIGRFLTKDSNSGTPSDTQSLNKYIYCEGDPINFTDPYGYEEEDADLGSYGGGGGYFPTGEDYVPVTPSGESGYNISSGIAGRALDIEGDSVESTASPKGARQAGALEEASETAFKAADNVDDFIVSNKHLMDAGGRWQKFATDSKSQVNDWIQEGLRSQNAQLLPNNQEGSYKIITDLGRTIGTKGETKIQIILGGDGKIWTAYPIK